jgi:hypothetical protein
VGLDIPPRLCSLGLARFASVRFARVFRAMGSVQQGVYDEGDPVSIPASRSQEDPTKKHDSGQRRINISTDE